MVIFLHLLGKLKQNFNRLRENGFSAILLVILIIIVTLIMYYRVKVQIDMGPMWDTYDFLSNALLFAGKGTGYSDLTRPPLLPFLTSLFFRLGYISEGTIFALDGVFLVFGVTGLYLLFKQRFNDVESFVGSLLFATFPVVILFSGAGLSDIPSVSLSIWAFYFTVLAVKKNSKFFYLSFLFAMLAFLTRYTAGLIIFPIFLYLLLDRKLIKNLKDMFTGILISFLALIPALILFYNKFGNPLSSFQGFFSSTENPSGAENYYYQPDLLFYLKKSFFYIGPGGIAIFLIILLGVIVYGFFGGDKIKTGLKKNLSRFNLKKKDTKIGIIAFLFLVLTFIFTFSKIPYMGSEILFFVLCLVSYQLLKSLEIKYMDLNFLFLAWFMAFFIFHSVFPIKDDRYFVTMAPAVAYFLILGFSEISIRLNFKTGFRKIKNRNLTSNLLSLLLIVIFLASTINYVPEILDKNYMTKEKADYSASASNWLKNYDPDYKNKIIYADYWTYFAWYLKMDVKPMPVFKDGKAYSYQLKDYEVDELSNKAYNDELNRNNVDYYFSNRKGLNLTYYRPIKQFGFITLYERIRNYM
jgi:4-amino-4-deoxy-L-arabinose transferase-like glycosyltransferase